MSGGIGESMLIGVAVGGGTALVTGNDPLQGALLGGVTGGISGAVGAGTTGSILGATGSAAAPAATSASTQAANMLGTNLASVPVANAATQAATQAASTGIAGITPTDVFGLANYTGPVAPNFATQAVSDTVSAPMLQAATPQNLVAAGQDMIPQVPMSAGAERGMFDRFNDWYGGLGTGEKIGYGIAGGVALQGLMGGLKQPQLELDEEEEENPMGLATYDRNVFKPYTPTPNVYRPNYANGGIASLPRSGMFPQGMQNATQYATPTQMPASAEVVRADYDPLTNPYSGEVVGMADGGTTNDALTQYLGKSPRAALASYMSSMDPRKTPTSDVISTTPAPQTPTAPAQPATPQWKDMNWQERMSFMQSMGIPTTGNAFGLGMTYNPYGFNRGIGGMGGREPLGMTYNPFDPYGQRGMFMQPQAAPSDNIAKNFTPYVAPTTNTQVYRPQFAKGGITGDGHLGDYAAGGMPRLLRGPGDGVSDDIPATIAGEQPARLADGEFVIPARIVSEIGNGSTDAGAKRLYAMMDRVQKKRGKTVGKNKVAVDSKAHKELAKV